MAAVSSVLTTGLGSFGSSSLVLTLGLQAVATPITTHFVTLLGQSNVSRTLIGQTQKSNDLIGSN